MKLDPIRVAKVIGWIFIVLSSVSLISGISQSAFIGSIIEIIAAYGLIKARRWGIYLLGISSLYNLSAGHILPIINNQSVTSYSSLLRGYPAIIGLLTSVVLGLGMFIYLYSNRKKFS